MPCQFLARLHQDVPYKPHLRHVHPDQADISLSGYGRDACLPLSITTPFLRTEIVAEGLIKVVHYKWKSSFLFTYEFVIFIIIKECNYL